MKKCLIVGRGKTGLSVQRYCEKKGILYQFWEDAIHTPDQIDAVLDDGIDSLVVSPSFQKNHPLYLVAQKKEIPVYTDIDLFFMENPYKKVIGITGTNGKSTTTALLHDVLLYCGLKSSKGGNIGIPVLDLPNDSDFYVFELSSYQLELSKSSPLYAGVFLNLTPDHLDWHHSIEAYLNAKKKIFKDCQNSVICIDDVYTNRVYNELINKNQAVQCCSTAQKADYWMDGDYLKNNQTVICRQDDFFLKGKHNMQNILAVIAVTDLLGIAKEKAIEAIKNFKGLEHRQEFVDSINGVDFLNDSKATNAESTRHALKAYEQDDVYWIVGGQKKEEGITPLTPFFDGLKGIYLMGQSQEEFSLLLDQLRIGCKKVNTLENAVRAAFDDAFQSKSLKRKVILLSPACASFDQFKNFEDRGDQFKRHVSELKKQKV